MQRAEQDDRCSARVVSRRGLFYRAGADPALDRPAHVRAASGVAWVRGAAWRGARRRQLHRTGRARERSGHRHPAAGRAQRTASVRGGARHQGPQARIWRPVLRTAMRPRRGRKRAVVPRASEEGERALRRGRAAFRGAGLGQQACARASRGARLRRERPPRAAAARARRQRVLRAAARPLRVQRQRAQRGGRRATRADAAAVSARQRRRAARAAGCQRGRRARLAAVSQLPRQSVRAPATSRRSVASPGTISARSRGCLTHSRTLRWRPTAGCCSWPAPKTPPTA